MVKTHTFRKLRYRVVLEKIEGYAEVPGYSPREIYIDPTLKPMRFLEVAIHEAMHAEDPEESEATVDRRAQSMARWLWRLGYRRPDGYREF
jgi:hypothetical protein